MHGTQTKDQIKRNCIPGLDDGTSSSTVLALVSIFFSFIVPLFLSLCCECVDFIQDLPNVMCSGVVEGSDSED